MENDELIKFDDGFVEKQTIIDIQDTITALKGYNFFLLQVSKSKIRPKKERNNAKDDIKVIERLINKYENILEDLKK